MGGPRPAPGKGCALLKIEFSARSFYTSQNIAENHEKKTVRKAGLHAYILPFYRACQKGYNQPGNHPQIQ
jgi:hypothetical protein